MRSLFPIVATLGLLTALPLNARAGDFLDTRVTFSLGDDNFRANAGETMVDSPIFGFGNRPGYDLFFDNLDTQYSGRENLLHLVLYKKLPGFIYGLTTEAAVVLKYNFSDSRDGALQDDGTYLRIVYDFDRNPEAKRGRKLDVTFFPVSTDRFRVGYLYDLTWGGARIFPGAYRNMTPGIKASFNWSSGYAFLGAKTARVLTNPEEGGGDTSEGRENETFGGALGGFGIDVKKSFRADASAGAFFIGENPRSGVRGELVQIYGASARVAYYRGMPIGISSDLRLYRNDAEFLESMTRKETYGPGFHFQISAEGNAIAQTLEDPDRFGSTTLQMAYAGAVSAKIKWRYLRAHLTGFVRNVPFILLNVPSFVPYQALSKDVETSPELFVATGADYYFKSARLTLGLMLGLQIPAEVTTQLTVESGMSEFNLGQRTLVIRDEGDFSIMPEGEKPVPIFAAKVSVKWDLSDAMSLVGMILFQYDNNFTSLVTEANGTARLSFEDPIKIGAMLFCQARF
ncbi:MAG: hypothetical protein RBU30_23240 [Polyangia bacterium]|nr:hypothetical protein [Polyangia bacterium]